MKKYNKFLLLTMLLIPAVVLAKESYWTEFFGMLFVEAFLTPHMTFFVIKPLAEVLKPEDKTFFWKLFWARVGILLFFDLFITPAICAIDFFAVFIGAFIVVPIVSAINKGKMNSINVTNGNIVTNVVPNNETIVLNCTKCGGVLKVDDNFCPNCGEPFTGNNVEVSSKPRVKATMNDFDPLYKLPEDKLLEAFINKELTKAGISNSGKNSLIPDSALKKKKILSIIFSLLVFIFISLIFFHFPIYTYIIGMIILIVFFVISKKYDFMDYLEKEIKSRPNEKISNIIMNTGNSLVVDNSSTIQIITILCAVIFSLVLFINPRIMYEKVEGGYAVRFYTFGITNYKTATIPETYKNEKVVSLRGNTFSNMPFLQSVNLPNTIKEIRGQAFKNDYSLTSVNIPQNLEYLGGGAFYNCKSIKEVILPDSLTYMGGETFYGASSLTNIKLSDNLTEVRGDSFEYCTSLTSIKIPDKVTRIGGHAFYGDTSLAEVSISENSMLKEIGSSAFRRCYNLNEIMIPSGTYVNGRAFKESPTRVRRFGEPIYDYGYEYEDEGQVDVNSYPEYEHLNISSKTFALGDKVYFNSYNTALNYANVNNEQAMFSFIYKDKEEKIMVPLKREEIFYYGIDGNVLSLTNNASDSVYALITKSYSGRMDYKYHFSTITSVKRIIRFKSGDTSNTGIITINSVKKDNDKTFLDLTLSGLLNEHVVLSDDNRVYSSDNLVIEMTRTYSSYVSLDIYFK